MDDYLWSPKGIILELRNLQLEFIALLQFIPLEIFSLISERNIGQIKKFILIFRVHRTADILFKYFELKTTVQVFPFPLHLIVYLLANPLIGVNDGFLTGVLAYLFIMKNE